jgi:hypothetical protein
VDVAKEVAAEKRAMDDQRRAELDRKAAEWKKAAAEAEARANPVSAAKYNKVMTGMTYDEVYQIIGVNGEELSRVEIGGITTVLFAWTNRNGSNMNVTFQNGKVVAKAQFGLP